MMIFVKNDVKVSQITEMIEVVIPVVFQLFKKTKQVECNIGVSIPVKILSFDINVISYGMVKNLQKVN